MKDWCGMLKCTCGEQNSGWYREGEMGERGEAVDRRTVVQNGAYGCMIQSMGEALSCGSPWLGALRILGRLMYGNI